MNEFTAKKLGEVLAFAKIGNETIVKAMTVFEELFSKTEIDGFIAKNNAHAEALVAFAKAQNVSEIVLPKSEKTGAKLVAMRDAYVGDEWNNPSEVFEWWGFFGGAALAHWNLVKGVGETLNDDVLTALAFDALGFHESLYNASTGLLSDIGREKAKNA
ncbi:MAG: hypothetical protein JWP09_37 [Candidatus Taylorbacteria bacterium]|nr:hypothetical protein [Candidatus Taylorbacteria bacterium]